MWPAAQAHARVELEDQGVRLAPTVWLARGEAHDLRARLAEQGIAGRAFLKPVVGAAPYDVLARQLPRLLVTRLNNGGDRGVRYFPFWCIDTVPAGTPSATAI